MTAYEINEELMGLDMDNNQFETLCFSTAVYGVEKETLDNWAYYWFAMTAEEVLEEADNLF